MQSRECPHISDIHKKLYPTHSTGKVGNAHAHIPDIHKKLYPTHSTGKAVYAHIFQMPIRNCIRIIVQAKQGMPT